MTDPSNCVTIAAAAWKVAPWIVALAALVWWPLTALRREGL